jgi:hypothetical protein
MGAFPASAAVQRAACGCVENLAVREECRPRLLARGAALAVVRYVSLSLSLSLSLFFFKCILSSLCKKSHLSTNLVSLSLTIVNHVTTMCACLCVQTGP